MDFLFRGMIDMLVEKFFEMLIIFFQVGLWLRLIAKTFLCFFLLWQLQRRIIDVRVISQYFDRKRNLLLSCVLTAERLSSFRCASLRIVPRSV